jgi:anti-sigma factor ChrR (cupin superfamily)
MSKALNGNLKESVVVDTNEMSWTESKSAGVWRKRLHLVGSEEKGQVTSIVRYDASSSFPAHDHPKGEEILVLSGVFSDERGDWPAGSYLLSPQGFRHKPFSKDGCELLVKLRQYPGDERKTIAMDTTAMTWKAIAQPGVTVKPMYAQAGYTDTMSLERWSKKTDFGVVTYEEGAEIYVMSGDFEDEHGKYTEGCWLRFPEGGQHSPKTEEGCAIYLKRGGLNYLKDGGS